MSYRDLITWFQLRGGPVYKQKSPDMIRAFTRVKDGARTRDLRNHNPTL